MGRQFGLIAVLTLMVLVIEFTPGCHGRTLSSKHHSHHHHHEPSGDSPPPPPQEGSGGSGNSPPPSQEESDVSDDRGYGSSSHPHPHPRPPPTSSSPPSEDWSDSSEDFSNGDSEGSDETAGKSFAQLKTLLTLLRSRVAMLSSPYGGGSHPHTSPPPHSEVSDDSVSDVSDVSELIDLFDEVSENREDSEDSDDSINSRPGNFSGSGREAIRELVIKIAQHIGLLDDEWKVHWDAMLALKEEQVDDVIKAVSEFVGKHFADQKGKVDWKAIAQALFGDGGLISGEYNSASSEETD